MKRALAATLLAVAALAATPASADIGGICDGKVDVACRKYACVPDYPCTIEICLVWLNGACKVG